MVKIVEDIFGIATNPFTNKAQVIRRYTMSNTNHMCVRIITLGATIQSIRVPDAYHQMSDVVLGFDDVAGYLKHQDLKFGCTLGRVAGLVSNGEFILEEHRVIVSKNLDQKHNIEGGFIGFNKVIWDLHMMRPDGITLRHVSNEGHEGFPGRLVVMIHFTIDNESRLFIRIEATSNKSTPVDICNHTYFNLAGHKAGVEGLFEHRFFIEGNEIIETSPDDNILPTGGYKSVDNSVYDLRLPVFMGDRVRQFKDMPVPGYHVTYALSKGPTNLNTRYLGRFLHCPSGRYMDIYSNQPALHFSTANKFPKESHGEDPIMGKNCTRYWQHGGYVLQLMGFPDACNQTMFPTIIVMPGENYFHETIYHFCVKEPWQCCATKEEIEAIDKDLVRNS
ncbi:aldose 1-epimerase [Drosophila pseudoobscura]|uniref:Galactose mutarotase n=1 Tax=Drosophila pseudoobscura pseudoobscura TaxID=46245 RepID=A0A6I8UZG6_DROPS|nr:aldose 1-epimerase [Drosophila pseudoobscura]